MFGLNTRDRSPFICEGSQKLVADGSEDSPIQNKDHANEEPQRAVDDGEGDTDHQVVNESREQP